MVERITTPEQFDSLLSSFGTAPALRQRIISRSVRLEAKAGADLGTIIAREAATPGTYRVHSFRMRNWRFHLGGVMEMVVGALAGIGGTILGDPFSAVGGLLAGLKGLVGASQVEVGDREARLLIALWRDGAPARIEKEVAQRNSELSKDAFESALDALHRLGTVEIEDDRWVVRTERIIFV